MTLENISILQQELKSIYTQMTAEEYLTALHVHLLKCLGFGPRNNFYYFSFVWNVENRQNVKTIIFFWKQTKQVTHTKGVLYYFRIAGASRNVTTFAHTHTHCAHHRRKWEYLALGEIMRELGWTSSFPLCLSLVLIFFSFSATLGSPIWGTSHPNTDIPVWSRQRKGLMRMLLDIWTLSINCFVQQ